jgi:hypothetical protein
VIRLYFIKDLPHLALIAQREDHIAIAINQNLPDWWRAEEKQELFNRLMVQLESDPRPAVRREAGAIILRLDVALAEREARQTGTASKQARTGDRR